MDLRSQIEKSLIVEFNRGLQGQYGIDPETVAAVVQQKTDEILAIVEAARARSGVTGALSEEELYEARSVASLRTIESCIDTMRNRLNGELPARQAAALSGLLQMAESDLERLRPLMANPTDEALREFADQSGKQFEDLARRLREGRNYPSGE